MKKIIFCFCTLVVWGVKLKAQTNLPYTLNSAGSYNSLNSQLHDFSIGEMVLIDTYVVGPYLLSQGFLQPYLLPLSSAADVFTENNVVTPNSDGKNDFLVIRGLDNYPGNKLNIYDRAGRKVFAATDYQNNWNGRLGDKILAEDAYYYIIELGKGLGPIKGSVTIIHDTK